MSSTESLPPALSSMWRALKRGYEAEPMMLNVSFGLSLLAAATRNGRLRIRRQPTCDGRITILVSHRFSTVRMADFIVVLDGSRVVESGTHEQLMARCGQYAELYRIQASSYR